MKKQQHPKSLDNTLRPGPVPVGIQRRSGTAPLGVQRRQQTKFPEVGQTLSTYKYDAFGNKPPLGKKKRFGKHAKDAKSGKRIKWTKKKIVFLILLPFLIVVLWLGIKFAYNISKIFGGNLLGVLSTTKLDGEDQGRVNILIAGNSADDIGHNGGNLTDSIMIVSIDTENHKAMLLSVPRDLYVDIPGYGHGKINAAFVAGQNQHFNEPGYPKGGMGLLEKTIQETLGIHSNYYALVNYSALRDMVNAVGGIDVNIQSSNPRGLYDPSTDWSTGGALVKLSNGWHHLNGRQALNLSRARGDAYGSYGYGNSDFTRTANQRMMMLALKNKVTTTGVLANPVKLSNLSDALGKNVKSDLEIGHLRRLYQLMKSIDNSKVASAGLNDIGGTNYLASARNASGSVLIPAAGQDNFTEIQAALKRLFSNNQIVNENASVVVLNATDSFGVAAANKSKLVAKFVNVSAIGDARTVRKISQIIDVSKDKAPNTLNLLKNMYGTNVITSSAYSNSYPSADFIILVGNDKLTAQNNP